MITIILLYIIKRDIISKFDIMIKNKVLLFLKPYDDIVSETAISTSGVFSEHEIEVLLL